MGEYPDRARLAGPSQFLLASPSGMVKFGSFMPNLVAMSFSGPAPRSMPILPNVVSHDWAKAVISGAWPLPSPQASPLSLVSTWLVWGSVSWVGEETLVLIVVLGLCVRKAALVTILNVDPGG